MKTRMIFLLFPVVLLFTGCNSESHETPAPDSYVSPSVAVPNETSKGTLHETLKQDDPDQTTVSSSAAEPPLDAPTPLTPSAPFRGISAPSGTLKDTPGNQKVSGQDGAVQVVANPESVTVLVNKQFALPEDYEPEDLVYPDVHFIFEEKVEKRMMRKEAAAALEDLFAGAKQDGIDLGGVSAYRSYATQVALFNHYVEKDGEATAMTYSAMPRHSEHETGLAIDISRSDGKCAAEDCFAGTKEADWLAEHAWEYGFTIRYPKGKESITGYKYEPWHLRYMGKEIAKEINEKGITLEEYLNTVPVSE